MWLQRFASNQNFLTPLYDEQGNPTGPKIYENLVNQCYIISRYINTPYNAVLDITPSERSLILKNINDETNRNKERLEQLTAKK